MDLIYIARFKEDDLWITETYHKTKKGARNELCKRIKEEKQHFLKYSEHLNPVEQFLNYYSWSVNETHLKD